MNLRKKLMTQRRAFSASVFPVWYESGVPQILLIKHNASNLWLPPGGEIEYVAHTLHDEAPLWNLETPMEAAKRELKEETGLEAWWVPVEDRPNSEPGYLGFGIYPAGSKGFHMNFEFMAFAKNPVVILDASASTYAWYDPYALSQEAETPPSVQYYSNLVFQHAVRQVVLARLALAQERS